MRETGTGQKEAQFHVS